MLSALMLYDDKYEDISYYLSKECLTPDDTSVFKNVVAEHISSTLQTVEYRLPSLGKEFLWLNTSRPLSLEDDLGKKVCVIDFFTYCCINCLHILPYLKEVETKHADNPKLAVIGIHCPKFPNEKHAQHVKDALIRNNIRHPVLNDPDCMLWTTFGITCWPTVYIVGPGRIVLFILMGEREIEKLPFLCDHVLKYFETCSIELDTHALPISVTEEPELSPDLLYPGNVSTNGEDILVSDTGHNRLLLMSSSLEIKEIIGSGIIGCNDGSFNNASFNSPHGTVWHKDVAYVADTGNHSIRKVDFKEKFVDTMFDSKKLAAIEENKTHKFCSPWDVCMGYEIGTDENNLNILYIAVSGSHQIWALDLGKWKSNENFCVPFAGSGQEENRPNCYRYRAGFAQPSGIACSKMFMPDTLFVADSESSTIKSVSLRDGVVKNIVGGGLDPTDLFQYGDKDGKGRQAKLQHPMSVCVLDCNTLIISDTYNHRIKTVDVTNCTCKSVEVYLGLNEPSGICILDEMLIIADTNNHRIVTVPISEMLPENIPKKFELETVTYNTSIHDTAQTVLKICDHAQIFCYFSISNEKLILNEKGIQKLDISFKGNKLDAVYRREKFFGKEQPSLILKSNLDKTALVDQQSEVTLVVSIPVCDKKLGLCRFKKALFKIAVNSTNSGVKSVFLKLNLNNELKLVE